MVLKNMEIFPLSLHSQRNGSRASYPSGLQPLQHLRRVKSAHKYRQRPEAEEIVDPGIVVSPEA